MVITFRQKQKTHFAFLYRLHINKLSLMSRHRTVCLAALIKTIYKCLYTLLVVLDPLSSKVFRYSGTSELQNTSHFHISTISIIKLLNKSS